MSTQFICESLEIMIASERILSSINPAEYHVSGRNMRMLLPLTILSIGGGIVQGYLCFREKNQFLFIIFASSNFSGSLHLVIAIIVCCLEMGSLVVSRIIFVQLMTAISRWTMQQWDTVEGRI